MIDPKKYHIAVLAGGNSGEREISLASGQGAHEALVEAGFEVEDIDPASKEDLSRLLSGSFDVAFICLHGKLGEDGSMQGFLEVAGIPYTGSGVCASAIAMDKAKSKPFYKSAGLNVPSSAYLEKGSEVDIDALIEKVGLPCVVKPVTEGSALGVNIVKKREDLSSVIEKTFEIDTAILVETYIAGTEVTVAVLGTDDPVALPIIEIVPSNEFYDFESKYAPGGSKHICPAPLSEQLSEKIKQAAVGAHLVLGCKGVSRTDMIVTEDDVPYILETNTIPGMTKTSLLPDAAAAAGMSFPELCTKLVEYALQ